MKKMLGMAALALALAACGSSGGGGSGNTTLACNLPTDGGCFEWTMPQASSAVVQSAFNSSCTSGGGSPVGSCSSASRVGRCTFVDSSGGVALTEVFSYYSSHFTTAQAQADCAGPGYTFTAN
jgi:hypothetical protein